LLDEPFTLHELQLLHEAVPSREVRRAAAASTHSELGGFSPSWMYQGETQVERQIITYPLSRDIAKLARLKETSTSYRLTLGQPRQEDMLDDATARERPGHRGEVGPGAAAEFVSE
jgi:hypothetical protein